MSNVKNTFNRPASSGPNQSANFLNLARTFWSIDGVPVTATAAQLNAAAGGGHNLVDVFFIASNGLDSNSGTNANEPVLTTNHLKTLLVSGHPTIINFMDAGTYAFNGFLIKGPTLINASAATFTFVAGASTAMFTSNTGSPLQINDALIDGAGSTYVFQLNSGIYANIFNIIHTNIIFQDVGNVTPAIFNIGGTDATGGAFNFGNTGVQSITANYMGTCTINSNNVDPVSVKSDYFNGSFNPAGTAQYSVYFNKVGNSYGGLTSAQVYNGFEGLARATFGGVTTTSQNGGQQGFFNDVVKSTMAINTDLTLTETMSGIEVILLDPSATHINIPSFGTNPNIPDGYYVDFTQAVQASGAQFVKQGSDILICQGQYSGAGTQRLTLSIKANAGNSYINTWTLGGNVFSSNFYTGPNFYVSQLNGDNVTADGSPNKQFATRAAALSYIVTNFTATPPHPLNIWITDDQTYTDKLDFTGITNVNLIGRESTSIYASSGPGDDGITTNSPAQLIALGVLGCTGGGKSLNNIGTGTIQCNIDEILTQGEVDNTSTGHIIIQSTFIRPNMPNTGGGTITYSTITRVGSDGVGVVGNSAVGTSGTWTANGDITSTTGKVAANTTVTAGTGMTAITGGFSAVEGAFQSFNDDGDHIAAGRFIDSQGGFVISRIDSPALTFTNLATAGHVGIISPAVGTNQFVITNIKLNGVGGTNFSGMGGDRDLVITDGTSVWTTIPATTLQGLVNNDWGSVDVPFSVSVSLNQSSAAGATIYAAYANGTTDYLAGSVTVTLEYARVV